MFDLNVIKPFENNILKNILFFSTLLVVPSFPTGPFLPDFFVNVYLFFYFLIIKFEKKKFLYLNKVSIFFFIFFIYIILNSFFAKEPFVSLKSTLFYFRFYFFAVAVCFLIKEISLYKKYLLNFLLITVSFIILDTFIQYFFGKDLFGFENTTHRLSGPFDEELIVGSYISKTIPVILSIYFLLNKKISNGLILLLFLSFVITFLSGERVSFFNLTIFLIIFLFFYEFKNKIKILFIILILSLSTIFLILKIDNSRYDRMVRYPICAMNLDYLKILECKEDLQNHSVNKTSKRSIIFFSEAHEGHFLAAYKMFLDEPIFGKGVKMFRYHCSDPKFKNKHSCTTHPHNTLIQILAELGIFGLFFLLAGIYFLYSTLIKTIFLSTKTIPENFKLSLILANFSLVQIFFIFLPSGQFFNNYLSIMYYLPLGIFLNLYYDFLNDRKY